MTTRVAPPSATPTRLIITWPEYTVITNILENNKISDVITYLDTSHISIHFNRVEFEKEEVVLCRL